VKGPEGRRRGASVPVWHVCRTAPWGRVYPAPLRRGSLILVSHRTIAERPETALAFSNMLRADGGMAMSTHDVHVDEITVWTWIAGVAVVLTLAAVMFVRSDKIKTPDMERLVPPIVKPTLLPPEMIADPKA
jgi:hypothetical protein